MEQIFEAIGMTAAFYGTLHVGWLILKAVVVTVYSVHVHRRAAVVARSLRATGDHKGAHHFATMHHWGVSIPALWLAPAPYLTIPVYERAFRRRCSEHLASSSSPPSA